MNTMLYALVIKELKCLWRDWHGLLVLFVMPAIFILVMSMALKDTFKPSVFAVGDPVIFGESSESVQWLMQELSMQPRVFLPERDISSSSLNEHEALWAIQLPPDFHRLMNDLDASLNIVVVAKPSVSMAILQALQSQVERAIAIARIQHVLNPQLAELGSTINTEQLAKVTAKHLVEEQRPMNAVQQSVPAWLTFGMFFVVIPLSNIVINERQQGTLFRLASLRVPASLILLGKWLPFYAVNLIQAMLMIVVGRYVVPILGGDVLALNVSWFSLWVIVSAISAAALGFAFVIASVAKTTEQATMLGGVGNILFGALGGIMVPTLVMPEVMRQLAKWSPMNWGMEGLLEVFAGTADWSQMMPPVTLLFGMGAVLMALATWRLQRVIHS